ncbi:glycosyltransferase family 4 protein [Clostridium perfringens]
MDKKIKVLMVNKFFYIKGGSETYLFALKKLLAEGGVETIDFSMKDRKNFASNYSDYFIENIDYSEKNIFKKFLYASKIIYNFESYKKMKKLLEDTNPDIVHLHLFQHQISPSIIKAIKEKHIPIVYTVHDLKPVCLNYKMLNSKGICEECKGGKYLKCLKNKCVKESYIFSFINVLEGYLHNFLKSYKNIDMFITPSDFYRNKLLENGFLKDRVINIDNFIDTSKFKPNYSNENYFVYVGRLSNEKGVKTLIEAMKDVKESTLKIVGSGPIEEELKSFSKLYKIKNIEFLGFKSQREVRDIVAKSKFMIIPSEWYENGPMSVLEAMAMGKAIIGANIGGIPEMVNHNINGYLFESGNKEELAKYINKLLQNDKDIINFGKESRKIMENKYSEKVHYNKIMKVYNRVLKNGING